MNDAQPEPEITWGAWRSGWDKDGHPTRFRFGTSWKEDKERSVPGVSVVIDQKIWVETRYVPR